MLIVGVDCWALRVNGGGARYVFESIIKHMDLDLDYKFILFLHPEAYKCIHELEVESGLLKNSIKIRLNSPSEITQYDRYYNIMYSPFNNNAHRYYNKPVVSLIHDVQERFLPELFSPQDLEGRIEVYDDIVRSSDKTITISEFCKSSLINYCGAESTDVEVVYNAPQAQLLKFVDDHILTNKKSHLGLSSNEFVFYPANFYPHKNHRRLLKAYQLASKLKNVPKLVFMGMTYGDDDSIFQDIKEFGLENKVVIVSKLKAEDLAWLYIHCICVVLPTLFEGFCMPAVEATSFRKNIVCSDLDILKEVTGNTGVYFDPYSPDSIKNQLLTVLNSNITQYFQSEPPSYCWKDSALKTQKIFKATFDEYMVSSAEALNLIKFIVFIDLDKGIFERYRDTLNSISSQKLKPSQLEVIFISDDSEKLALLPSEFIHSLKSEIEDVESDYYYLISSGNQLVSNFFQNIATQQDNSNNVLMFEVEQCHEDVAMTFESNIYMRIFEEHYYLKGDLYPELFVFKSFDILKSIITEPSKLSDILISAPFSLNRKLLAKVMYLSSVPYRRNISKISALRYEPSMNYDLNSLDENQILLNKNFVEYVDTVIADELGCGSPNKVTEANKLFNLIKGNG